MAHFFNVYVRSVFDFMISKVCVALFNLKMIRKKFSFKKTLIAFFWKGVVKHRHLILALWGTCAIKTLFGNTNKLT
jgi:hypothetical protein